MRSLHAVVPEGLHDPARPSGGNTYDRRVVAGLRDLGWQVAERPVAGAWPWADGAARGALARTLAAIPDGGLVLVDGLLASTTPDVLVPEADRLRLVVLMHMPLGQGPAAPEAGDRVDWPEVRAAESAVLGVARAVVTTSAWTRDWLLGQYDVAPARVTVARPGVDPAEPAMWRPSGEMLLKVATVLPAKGHDVLLGALTGCADLTWRCACVGTLERDPGFVTALAREAHRAGLADRWRLVGPRAGADLDAAYSGADVVVLASRAETYGMVVTEALARGLPVIATTVGGVPEALGLAPDGSRPGLLVPPGDPGALAAAIRDWLTDAGLRDRLRAAAAARRAGLRGWEVTSALVSTALDEVLVPVRVGGPHG